MATLSPTTRNVPNQPAVELSRAHSLLYRIGRFILIILVLLVSLIIAVPIGLLFVATSVPWMISLVLVVVYIVIAIGLFRFAHTLPLKGLAFIGMITLSVLAVVASQLMAATPAITDSQGQPIPNSIASLERVTLGGTEQWITIRGQDIHNPVLLFLAGGPGGSELVMTRRYLSELEAHFVVVNWDQPGAGKSYNAVDISTLTPERYVSDAYELTQVLRERFQQEKIYVLGEVLGQYSRYLVGSAASGLISRLYQHGADGQDDRGRCDGLRIRPRLSDSKLLAAGAVRPAALLAGSLPCVDPARSIDQASGISPSG